MASASRDEETHLGPWVAVGPQQEVLDAVIHGTGTDVITPGGNPAVSPSRSPPLQLQHPPSCHPVSPQTALHQQLSAGSVASRACWQSSCPQQGAGPAPPCTRGPPPSAQQMLPGPGRGTLPTAWVVLEFLPQIRSCTTWNQLTSCQGVLGITRWLDLATPGVLPNLAFCDPVKTTAAREGGKWGKGRGAKPGEEFHSLVFE